MNEISICFSFCLHIAVQIVLPKWSFSLKLEVTRILHANQIIFCVPNVQNVSMIFPCDFVFLPPVFRLSNRSSIAINCKIYLYTRHCTHTATSVVRECTAFYFRYGLLAKYVCGPL